MYRAHRLEHRQLARWHRETAGAALSLGGHDGVAAVHVDAGRRMCSAPVSSSTSDQRSPPTSSRRNPSSVNAKHDPLLVACGRPARHRARRVGAATPKRVGRQEVLPQPAQGPAMRAACDRHRQAPQLRSGASGGDALGRAPTIEIPEQPGGELPSAHQATRAGDEALHNPPGTRNGSCRRSAASRRTFGPVGTCCRRPTTDRSWPAASRSGTRSPGRPPPEGELGQVFPPEPMNNTRTIDPNHQAHQLT